MERIKLDPLTLKFAGEYSYLEESYKEDFFHRQLFRTRIGTVLTAFLFICFLPLDNLLIGENNSVWVLRLFLVAPMCFFIFLMSYTKFYEKFHQAFLVTAILTCGFSILAMIYMIPFPASQYYYAGLMMVVVYGYILIPIRFIYATPACWLLVIAYQFAAIKIGHPWELIINNNFFFISYSVVGMFSNYGLERASRISFFHKKLVEKQEEKLKDINDELEEHNSMLKLEIDERIKATKLLKESQKELMQASKMATVGTLVSGVAHVINNPMAIISGNLQVIDLEMEKLGIKSDAYQRRYSKITQAMVRIANIVSGLKTFVQSETGKEDLINFQDIIDNVLKITYDMYKTEDVEIITRIEAEDSNVLGCKNRFQQALMNILSNAKDAYENMPGELIIATRNENSSFILEVIDSGKGIKEKELDHIYDAFFTTKDPGKKIGLGLSITKSIISNSGGSIEIKSKEDEGTTVRMVLPLANCQKEGF